MTIADYINDLLYRYDCVIVPEFGGFVTNKVGTTINEDTNTFYPPKKQITFNAYLQHNDGLLANYIASTEGISFEEATKKIVNEVSNWKKQLETNVITIASIGSLVKNEENQLVFEPNKESNFLAESFGLADTQASTIEREEKIKQLPVEEETATKKVIPMYVKGAAAAAVVMGITYGIWNGMQNQQQQEVLASQEKSLEKKIQSATFVIDNPLPTINLKVTKEEGKNFHIIAGAFQEVDNAHKKVEELKLQGFEPKIIGKNSWGLTQVAYKSYATKQEARKELLHIKETVSEDAWLLEK
ncbi:SPOR domain-containing protein [Tenacibaculum sp. 190524A02b]|uniref:HU domain-containing protein n=1 Tax=Tenacibaculum vairaonense TaxID=3137860 RepID=UPI0031FB7F83